MGGVREIGIGVHFICVKLLKLDPATSGDHFGDFMITSMQACQTSMLHTVIVS